MDHEVLGRPAESEHQKCRCFALSQGQSSQTSASQLDYPLLLPACSEMTLLQHMRCLDDLSNGDCSASEEADQAMALHPLSAYEAGKFSGMDWLALLRCPHQGGR